MAYPSLTLHLLISAPGDVPEEDRRVVREAIDTWNFTSGRYLAPTPVTVTPIEWGVHAYSQMFFRPQESLNKQLVEEADIALAMFANRLGTATGEADSGTIEEIEVMRKAGKPVSLVRNTSVPLPPGTEAADQRMKLEAYLGRVRADRQGLYVEYDQLHQLARQIDLMLTGHGMEVARAASTSRVTAEQEVTWNVEEEPDPNIGVWPSTEFVERAGVDTRGRPKVTRKWFLVLTNRTGKPVKNVDYRYEPESFSWRLGGEESIDLLPPDGSIRFSIEQSLGSAGQANCTVTWQYAHGPDQDEHETTATVRT